MSNMSGNKGIKSMRSNTSDTKPKYDCPNCRCKRYSRCGCIKGFSNTEVPVQTPENTKN
jgi:hypothetical protein